MRQPRTDERIRGEGRATGDERETDHTFQLAMGTVRTKFEVWCPRATDPSLAQAESSSTS